MGRLQDEITAAAEYAETIKDVYVTIFVVPSGFKIIASNNFMRADGIVTYMEVNAMTSAIDILVAEIRAAQKEIDAEEDALWKE